VQTVKVHTEQDETNDQRWEFTMRQDKEIKVVRMQTSSGFTVIEILIVLVIIGIAAAMVVPMISSAASVQIRSAAEIIAADLEYAKSMAISRGQKFAVVFDKTTDSYCIKDQDGNIIAHPVKKGFNYVMDFRNDNRLNKVDIVNVNFDATSCVKFDYLGSPYNGNDNSLNSGIITLQAGGMTTTVSVEPVTGFISITE
jgi:prepilin-type N-terminal cleavage/methylation domain-containing protein